MEKLKLIKFSYFSLFAVFYSVGLWLEMAENWDNPIPTAITLVLLLAIIITGIDKLKFCLFVSFTTSYFLYFHFPEVANHVNLILIINFTLLAGAVYTWLKPQFTTDNDYYGAIAPIIRIFLVLVYFWAGFHKLNRDFFNTDYSCASSTFTNIIRMLFADTFGIPNLIILGAIGSIFVYKTIFQQYQHLLKSFVSKPLFKIISISLLILALAAGLSIYFLDLVESIKFLAFLATIIIVIVWELAGSVLLFISACQAAVFFISMFMHLVLAPIGFVDFGSLIFALWLVFIPQNYHAKFNTPVKLPVSNLKFNRSLVYIIINVVGGIVAGVYHLTFPYFNNKALTGIIFITSVLIVIAPSVKAILAEPKSWQGISLVDRQTPCFLYIFVLILSFWAMTPYLGLRTAGNFSMFSNLRTEKDISNHLLLGSNPLKIWEYQENVIKFIEINDEQAKVGHKYRPLKDNYLPVVEFRKLIHKWTQAGYEVPLVFEHDGQVYKTSDIVNDPVWRTPERSWEMFMMDFRVVQPGNGEPNYCRW